MCEVPLPLPLPLLLICYNYADNEYCLKKVERSNDKLYDEWFDIAKIELCGYVQLILEYSISIPELEKVLKGDNKFYQNLINRSKKLQINLKEKAKYYKETAEEIMKNPESYYNQELMKRAIKNSK